LFKKCGTPGFVAPEVLNSSKKDKVDYDCKCDIYSAGIILYYMLSGRLPFNSKEMSEVVRLNKFGIIDYDIEELDEYKNDPYV